MPKLNYGFKGDTITATQAIAAGAPATGQDYTYALQQGAITPLVAPSAPNSLSATAGDATASVSWSAPTTAGTTAVTGYLAVCAAPDGSEVTAATGSTSYSFTGLTNGSTYLVSVAAANESAGLGTFSTVSVTPVAPTVPGAPTGLSGTAGDTQVPLTWTAPSSNGGASITGYVVEWTPSGGSASTVSTGSATASYTKTSLTNSTAYGFRVAAVNSVGTGAYSSSVTVTPTAPSGPTFTAASGTNNLSASGVGTSTLTLSRTSGSATINHTLTATISSACVLRWTHSNTTSGAVTVGAAFYWQGSVLQKNGKYEGYFGYGLPCAMWLSAQGEYVFDFQTQSNGTTAATAVLAAVGTAPASGVSVDSRGSISASQTGYVISTTRSGASERYLSFSLSATSTMFLRLSGGNLLSINAYNRPGDGWSLQKSGIYAADQSNYYALRNFTNYSSPQSVALRPAAYQLSFSSRSSGTFTADFSIVDI